MNAYQTQDYTLVKSLNCKMSAAMDDMRDLKAWRAVLAGDLDVRLFDSWQRMKVKHIARTMEAA